MIAADSGTELLLLATVWLAWQSDRVETVAEVANCVEQYLNESDCGAFSPDECGEAVRTCYEIRGERDDFSEEW